MVSICCLYFDVVSSRWSWKSAIAPAIARMCRAFSSANWNSSELIVVSFAMIEFLWASAATASCFLRSDTSELAVPVMEELLDGAVDVEIVIADAPGRFWNGLYVVVFVGVWSGGACFWCSFSSLLRANGLCVDVEGFGLWEKNGVVMVVAPGFCSLCVLVSVWAAVSGMYSGWSAKRMELGLDELYVVAVLCWRWEHRSEYR